MPGNSLWEARAVGVSKWGKEGRRKEGRPYTSESPATHPDV